jgi:hypothetical protein
LLGGWKFLVEKEVNDVLRGKCGQFRDGIATIVDPFARGYE